MHQSVLVFLITSITEGKRIVSKLLKVRKEMRDSQADLVVVIFGRHEGSIR